MTESIQLQGIGRVAAVPARELQPGWILSWNYSPASYRVVAVRDISVCFIEIDEANIKSGQVSTRRLKKDRLVAASAPRS